MKKIIIILSFTVALAACKKDYSNSAESRKSNLKKVRVTTTDRLVNKPSLNATGKLTLKDEVLLSFKTGGIIETLTATEGEKISSGKRLASLNLSEINAQVRSAQNAYDKSLRDYDRATNLYRDTVGTLQQKQNAKTASDIAQSQLEIAKFNQQYSVINAPFQGIILKKFVEEGQLIAAGQPVYLVGRSGQKGAQTIKAGLSDREVVQLELGSNATVVFDAFLNKEYRGTVTQITEVPSASTGLYDVEVTLNTYDAALKNGFIGRISITPKEGVPTLKIPMNVLVEGNDRSARIFYTLDKKTVKEAQVEIIDLSDDYFTIQTEAVPANAQLISEGAPFLKVNDSIQIIK